MQMSSMGLPNPEIKLFRNWRQLRAWLPACTAIPTPPNLHSLLSLYCHHQFAVLAAVLLVISPQHACFEEHHGILQINACHFFNTDAGSSHGSAYLYYQIPERSEQVPQLLLISLAYVSTKIGQNHLLRQKPLRQIHILLRNTICLRGKVWIVR